MLNFLSDLFHDLGASVADWRHRRQAYAELAALDDRSLADIGLTRAEIPFVLSHATGQGVDLPTSAANTNLQHAA
jgi:uncharacterized protein YjiS (DUF1127 family)